MTCLAIAPPRRPKEWKNSWAYGHALPRAKTPTIFVPTQPTLSANAWEYNQISLSWVQPLIGAQPGDYYEVQISTDGGTTWEEHCRRIPYSDIQTGAIQTGADFAGFDPGMTYHFRVRPFRRTVPDFTFFDWSNVATATTPNYVQSGQPTSTGGIVRVVNNRAQWVALDNVVQLGDIVELSLSATDLSTIRAFATQVGPGKWVTVRSQGYDTSGLKYDKRVTAADLSKMATVWVDGTTNGNVQALGAQSRAKYWTFEGLHIQCRKSGGGLAFPWANAAVDFGPAGIGNNQTTTLADMKSHIELHRCYIDKTTDTTNSAEGVLMNNIVFGVVKDCEIIGGYLFDGTNSGEGRGLAAYTSENVIVDNCGIAGASISFMLDRPCALNDGSNRTNNKNWLIKRSWFNKKQAWKDNPSQAGMKNLIEFKRATDCDYLSCIGEFNRVGGNQVMTMLYTPRGTNQSGTVFGNFRMDYCIFRDITGGLLINTSASGGTLSTRDLVIENTLIDGISGRSAAQTNAPTWFTESGGDQNIDNVANIYHRHCTFIDRDKTNQLGGSSGSRISHFEASSDNPQLVIDNYVFEHCMVEFLDRGVRGAGPSSPEGTAALNAFCTSYSFTDNVLGGDSAANVPANYMGDAGGNTHENQATFESNFESYATGDYRLKSSSIHKGAVPGGKDRGADIAMLNAKTLHVVDGNWTEVLPTDIDDLEEWADDSYQMFKDAGVTIAADGDTVQQGIGRSSLALVRSNATASQRPKLKAATLAVPCLEYNATTDSALVYPVDTLDLRTDDATFFFAFQYPEAGLASAQKLAGNLPSGAGQVGFSLGVALAKLHQTYIYDATNFVGLDRGTIEVNWGDMVIAMVRWDNSTGTMEKYVQRSDSNVLVHDATHTIAAAANKDINSVVAFAIGRSDGQTTNDSSFRGSHFLMYRRKLSDFECQTVTDAIRTRTDFVPKYWSLERDAANPVNFRPTTEVREQYVPAPILLPNSVRLFKAKGANDIYLWRSDSFNVNDFQLQNNGAPVITNGGAGSDDELGAVEPFSQVDGTTIHDYYKGINASGVPSIRHATSSTATPTVVTKQGTVLTAAAFATAFAGETVIDIHVGSRLKINGTWNVFGGRRATTGTKAGWRLWRGTDTGFGTTITLVSLLDWPRGAGDLIVQYPTICKNPNGSGYFMIYALGKEAGGEGERNLYCCYSEDGNDDDWQHIGTILIHEQSGWETSRVYCSELLMQPSGNYDLPAVVNGKWQLFYSASNLVATPKEDLVGILHMTPL